MGHFKTSGIFILFLTTTSVHLLHTSRRASFIGCVDSSECSEQQCCALGGGRYTSPQCLNHGEISDSCRPYGTVPFNTTLDYPSGYSVDVTNVYFVMCDCASGLVCDRDSSTCQAPQILTENFIR